MRPMEPMEVEVLTDAPDHPQAVAAVVAKGGAGGGEGSSELLADTYRLEALVGRGSWGEVYRSKNVHTGQEVAIKVVDLNRIRDPKEHDRTRLTLSREIAILKRLNHPNIVKLYEAFEKDDKIFLVMEFVTGGELFHYVLKKGVLPEDEARKFFRQMISALEYCHSGLIIHRDLKLENVLLDQHGNIKITDFGFSNFIEPGKLFSTFCGSPMYSPPEIFGGVRYLGPPADIWSLGVILFALVSGCLPFSDVNGDMKLLRKRVCMGVYEIPDVVPADCKVLIKKMMQVRQDKRITIEKLRKDHWVNKGCSASPDSYLPSYPKITDWREIDVEILNQMAALGFDKTRTMRHLMSKPNTQLSATYYHLLHIKSPNLVVPLSTPDGSHGAAQPHGSPPKHNSLWSKLIHF